MEIKSRHNSHTLQKLLIRYILSPLCDITDKISYKIKDICFIVSGIMLVLLFFAHSTSLFSMRYLIYFCIGCFFLGIMILCTINKNMKPIEFRPVPMVLWCIVGVTTLISGIFNSIDFLPEAVLFVVAYPIIFVVWNNNDEKYIFSRLTLIIKISFLVCVVLSALFFPMLSLRYSGLFTNVNGAAAYYVIVFVFLLVEFLHEKFFSANFIGDAILLGVCISLIMYTNSRTGLIGLILTTILGLCIHFFTNTRKHKMLFFGKVSLLIVSAVLFFITSTYIFQFGKYINLPSLNMYSKTNETINFEESLDLSKDRLFITDPDNIEGIDESIASVYSTGRLGIWTEYAKQLNLIGHKDAGTAQFSYKGENKTYHTAHMTILQFAYENGIISGIAYFMFNIIAGIISITYAVRQKNNNYSIIPLLVSIAYGVHSLFSTTTISFWYLSALMYYLVQFPVMKKEQTKPEG